MKNETLNDTSELLLKRIKQLAKIGTWEYNLEKDELTASEEAFEIFGITDKPSSVNLDFFFKNIHPDDFEKVRTEYSNSIINRSLSYEIEHRVINKTDNSIKYVLEKCDNIINKDGKVEKSLGIIQDISDRKNIADELSLSTGKFESIFKTAPLGIGVVVNRTFSEVNKYFLSMLGYTKKELLGQNARIIYPSDEEYENVGKVKYRQINKSGIGFVQTKFKTKKGKIIDISMYSRPIDLADYSKGVIFTAEDITIFKKLQNDLKSSEEKFRAMYEDAPLSYQSLDINGDIIDVNTHWLNSLGYSKEEVLGKPFGYFWPDETKEYFPHTFSDFKKAGRKHNVQLKLRKKDGNVFDALYEGQIGYHPDGSFKQTYCVFKDITKEKSALQQLKDSEEKFSKAFHRNPTICALAELETGIYIEINKAFINKLGYTKEECVGKRDIDVLNIDKDFNQNMVSTLKQKGFVENLETTLYKKNGIPITVLISAEVIEINEKKYNYTSALDITERKKMEEDLKIFSKAIEQSQLSIIITDTEGLVKFVNPKFSQVTGYSFQNVRDRKTNILKSGNLPQKFYESMWETIKSGRDWTGTFHNKKKNGELFWESANISPIKNSQDEITHFVALKEDITERVNQEKELEAYRTNLEDIVKERTKLLEEEINKREKAEKEATILFKKEKEINQFRAKFVSIVSHEFRTPLTSLYSSLELLERYGNKWDPSKKEEHYTRMKTSIEGLTEMLDEMLTLNRSESNKIIFSPQLTDLENFGKKIVEDFKPILHQKENLKYLFSLKEKEYSIDRNLLSVILNNLISNAIKYSKEKIEISLVFSEDKDNITFMVADKGMGINKEDINNIFQPFYRTAKSETIKGTGLGLSIVKNYVELHKGKITVESEPNNGSTFFVSIPKLKLNGK